MGDFEIASFSQNPDAALLKKHMSQNYPDAEIKVVSIPIFPMGFE
jgi:hypothetical protein